MKASELSNRTSNHNSSAAAAAAALAGSAAGTHTAEEGLSAMEIGGRPAAQTPYSARVSSAPMPLDGVLRPRAEGAGLQRVGEPRGTGPRVPQPPKEATATPSGAVELAVQRGLITRLFAVLGVHPDPLFLELLALERALELGATGSVMLTPQQRNQLHEKLATVRPKVQQLVTRWSAMKLLDITTAVQQALDHDAHQACQCRDLRLAGLSDAVDSVMGDIGGWTAQRLQLSPLMMTVLMRIPEAVAAIAAQRIDPEQIFLALKLETSLVRLHLPTGKARWNPLPQVDESQLATMALIGTHLTKAYVAAVKAQRREASHEALTRLACLLYQRGSWRLFASLLHSMQRANLPNTMALLPLKPAPSRRQGATTRLFDEAEIERLTGEDATFSGADEATLLPAAIVQLIQTLHAPGRWLDLLVARLRVALNAWLLGGRLQDIVAVLRELPADVAKKCIGVSGKRQETLLHAFARLAHTEESPLARVAVADTAVEALDLMLQIGVELSATTASDVTAWHLLLGNDVDCVRLMAIYYAELIPHMQRSELNNTADSEVSQAMPVLRPEDARRLRTFVHRPRSQVHGEWLARLTRKMLTSNPAQANWLLRVGAGQQLQIRATPSGELTQAGILSPLLLAVCSRYAALVRCFGAPEASIGIEELDEAILLELACLGPPAASPPPESTILSWLVSTFCRSQLTSFAKKLSMCGRLVDCGWSNIVLSLLTEEQADIATPLQQDLRQQLSDCDELMHCLQEQEQPSALLCHLQQTQSTVRVPASTDVHFQSLLAGIAVLHGAAGRGDYEKLVAALRSSEFAPAAWMLMHIPERGGHMTLMHHLATAVGGPPLEVEACGHIRAAFDLLLDACADLPATPSVHPNVVHLLLGCNEALYDAMAPLLGGWDYKSAHGALTSAPPCTARSGLAELRQSISAYLARSYSLEQQQLQVYLIERLLQRDPTLAGQSGELQPGILKLPPWLPPTTGETHLSPLLLAALTRRRDILGLFDAAHGSSSDLFFACTVEMRLQTWLQGGVKVVGKRLRPQIPPQLHILQHLVMRYVLSPHTSCANKIRMVNDLDAHGMRSLVLAILDPPEGSDARRQAVAKMVRMSPTEANCVKGPSVGEHFRISRTASQK